MLSIKTFSVEFVWILTKELLPVWQAIEKGYNELRNIAKVLIPKLKVQINHGKTTFSVETSS